MQDKSNYICIIITVILVFLRTQYSVSVSLFISHASRKLWKRAIPSMPLPHLQQYCKPQLLFVLLSFEVKFHRLHLSFIASPSLRHLEKRLFESSIQSPSFCAPERRILELQQPKFRFSSHC